MLKPWPVLRSTTLGDFRVFKIRRDVKVSPRTGQELDFHVLECPDWVNVVALTEDGMAVLVEQYRHGTDSMDLELPGGVMDGTDPSPVETAVRELREETGYEGANARLIGQVAPNPAILNNTCFTVLIEDCVQRRTPQFDAGEDLVTRLVPARQLPELVATRQIRHSLMVAALYQYELLRRR